MTHDLIVTPLKPPRIIKNTAVNNTIYMTLGENVTLYCGSNVRGSPQPEIKWTKYDLNTPVKDMIVGPDDSGNTFRYTYEIKNRNKILHLVASPISIQKAEQFGISSRDLQVGGSIEGKYFCTASNRGGCETVFTEVEVKSEAEEDKSMIWAGVGIPALLVIAFGVALFGFFRYHK